MRILLVVHSFPPFHWRGTEVYTYELSQALSSRHTVAVCHLVNDPKAEPPRQETVSEGGLAIHRLRKRLDPAAPADYFFDQRLDRLFEQILAEFRPEVVHFTYFLGGLSARFPALARAAGAKTVFTVTDDAAICPRGQLLDSRFQPCPGPRAALRCLPCLFDQPVFSARRGLDRFLVEHFPVALADRLRNAKLQLLRRLSRAAREALEQADQVIFPNDHIRRVYAREGIRNPSSQVLDFGIATRPFQNHRKQAADQFRLAFIGQLLPHKGLHVLVNALRELKREDWSLTVYGSLNDPGSREYFDSLELARLKRASYAGVFAFDQMNRVLEQTDALVVPSTWDENCPLIVKYGLVTGTWTVLSDVAGIIARREDLTYVRFFPVGDARALAAALEDLLARGERPPGRFRPHPAVTDMQLHAAQVEALYRGSP
jgi:glycosyltransferase involved in cell wall biosynthesis